MTGLPIPQADQTDGSPAISSDCRTLYFVRLVAVDGGTFDWTIRIAHR
jgi:hypothetical protein